MQRKGFRFIAFFLSGLLWALLPIEEMRSEDVSTSGWMSVKVLWLNCLRANRNCYEKGLWVITNLQKIFPYRRKTTEIEDLDMYCLRHSTIIYPFSFNTCTICFHKIYCVQNYSLVVIFLCSS